MRWSSHFQTEFLVLRPTPRYQRCHHFVYGTFTFFGPVFQTDSTMITFYNSFRQTGLLPFQSPLLRESLLLSFPPGTKMFQFSGFASYNYLFIIRYQQFVLVGSPIRISTDLCVLTAPRSVSPFVASFFAYQCQGILRALFLSLPYIFFFFFRIQKNHLIFFTYLFFRYRLCDKYYPIFKDLYY